MLKFVFFGYLAIVQGLSTGDHEINKRKGGLRGRHAVEETQIRSVIQTDLIKVDIKCTVQSGAESVPCENYTVQGSTCNHDLVYTYTATNLSDEPIRIQSIVNHQDRQGDLSLSEGPVLVKPDVTVPKLRAKVVAEKTISTNLCVNEKIIQTNARIFAVSFDGTRVGDASASYEFTTSSFDLNWEINNIACTINDEANTPCQDYTGGVCNKEVIFKYTIKNTGVSCHSIDNVLSKVDNMSKIGVPLDMIKSCGDRNICPDIEWVITDRRYIDFCSTSDSQVPIKVFLESDDKTYVESSAYSLN